MKIALTLVVMAALTVQQGSCGDKKKPSTTIGPGNWVIRDYKQYEFPMKRAGDFDVIPTLVVGSNGSRLELPITARDSTIAEAKASDLVAEVRTDGGALGILEAPPQDLEEIMDMPIAMWYMQPPASGKVVTEIVVTVRGTSVTWAFSEGRQIH